MRCSSATWTTSCGTARCTSSTSPGAGWPGCSAGPTACTRRSRRRRAWPRARAARSSTAITIQSLVRRYRTVCGMTGTAVAVGEQFREFYGLEIAVIPPNRPCVRADEPDRLYADRQGEGESDRRPGGRGARHRAAHPDRHPRRSRVRTARRRTRPRRAARAPCSTPRTTRRRPPSWPKPGAYGAITVSTQMAGRGTDIRLGGTSGDRDLIAALGGLYVIGTGQAREQQARPASCAGAPGARATRAGPSSSPAWKTS